MADTPTEINDIIGYDALYESLQKCRKSVGWKSTTGYYVHNWNTELLKMNNELLNDTYKKHKPKFFTLTEPKQREIMSIHFRDRIYIRSLNDNAFYPQIIKSLIPDNFACQKGKGTDSARERMKYFLQDYYRKYGTEGYALLCDIKGYYPNMDRQFSKEIVADYLDYITNEYIQRELDSHPGDKGYNPGEQTIQNVGIVALDKLDHYVKERLHIRYYIRYMDDFPMLHPNKGHLEYVLSEIQRILESYKMELNDKKTKIQPITDVIPFLGFNYRLTESGKVLIFANPKKIKHNKKKIKRIVSLVEKNERNKRDVDVLFKSWKAYLQFGNNKQLIKNLNSWYNDLWKGE